MITPKLFASGEERLLSLIALFIERRKVQSLKYEVEFETFKCGKYLRKINMKDNLHYFEF